MPWAKGQSGNPKGVPVDKPFLDALRRAIAQDDAVRLRKAAESLLDAAADGQQWAVQFLADKMDGKIAQAVNMTGSLELGLAELLAARRQASDRSD